MTREQVDDHGDKTLNAAGGGTMNPFVATAVGMRCAVECTLLFQQRMMLTGLELWLAPYRR